jgi:hypothetical protein
MGRLRNDPCEAGLFSADDFSPQNAGLVLSFALTADRYPGTIQRLFTRY